MVRARRWSGVTTSGAMTAGWVFKEGRKNKVTEDTKNPQWDTIRQRDVAMMSSVRTPAGST